MYLSLSFTALLMGLLGGPHCLAMCGAACAGLGQAAGPRRRSAILTFQIGRVLGYAGLGAVAAASMQSVGWLSVHAAALRPLWSLLHVAALVLGLALLWQARQPVWLEAPARRLWARVREASVRWGRGAPLFIGMGWAFLPCGLLYSALMVAALSAQAVQGALVMALFAAGSGVSMTVGSLLWLRLAGGMVAQHIGPWGVRVAGLALAGSAGWALWMGLVHNTAPWCVTGA